MINQLTSVKAFAPATCANVAVGFDVLGFAVATIGDEVTLTKSDDQMIRIDSIISKERLPYDVDKNTATIALNAMLNYLNVKQGFKVVIKKGIPLSSGLGGSAASSVAALTALNQFLTQPLSKEQLIEFALSGEKAACGSAHGDNVIPCLYGGMTLIQSLNPPVIINLPLIPLYIVLIHPHIRLDTRDSRAVLKPNISLSLFTRQNARMAGFISALYEKNYEQLEACLVDEVIEPARAHLIPNFYEVKSVAYQYGALACSISGSGPTMFALAACADKAKLIAEKMCWKFKINDIQSDTHIVSFSTQGARVIHEE